MSGPGDQQPAVYLNMLEEVGDAVRDPVRNPAYLQLYLKLVAHGMAQASVAQQMRAAQASAEAAQCFPGSPKPLLNVVATTLSSGLGNPGKLPLQPQNPEP